MLLMPMLQHIVRGGVGAIAGCSPFSMLAAIHRTSSVYALCRRAAGMQMKRFKIVAWVCCKNGSGGTPPETRSLRRMPSGRSQDDRYTSFGVVSAAKVCSAATGNFCIRWCILQCCALVVCIAMETASRRSSEMKYRQEGTN